MLLMGQGSKPITWSTRGGCRWKKEDSIKKEEAPRWEGGKNTVTTGTRLESNPKEIYIRTNLLGLCRGWFSLG